MVKKKRGRLKVKETDSLANFNGYMGMNPRAARELGIHCPPRTILVRKDLPPAKKRRIIRHEKVEYRLMGPPKRLKYKEAHAIAERTAVSRRRRKKKR